MGIEAAVPQTTFRLVLCLITQSCPTLCDAMGYSLPGSSVHGDSPGKNTRVGCLALLQGILLTKRLNWCLLYWQAGSFVFFCSLFCFIFFFNLFLIGRKFLYNILLGSVICQHESTIGIHMSPPSFFFSLFQIYFSWRLITLQYCGGFCHTLI